MKQTASLFPVKFNDNQLELIHSSIGELSQFSDSKLITTSKTILSQKTSTAVRPKSVPFSLLSSKTESQSMQCLAFDFQNTLQHNSSADKKTKLRMHSEKMSKCFKLNVILKKEELQRQKSPLPNHKFLNENCSHLSVLFNNNQFSIAQKVSNNTLSYFNQSKLV